MAQITLALAKGRLLPPSWEALARCGYQLPALNKDVRQAVFELDNGLRLIIIRDDDVPTYVAYGTADLGIVGKDVMEESGEDVVELADLLYAPCRLVLAMPEAKPQVEPNLTIATKYPRLSTQYFRERSFPARIIHVHGATELAPTVGLSDGIVDLVATGGTLQVNRLVEVATLLHSSARLIGNPAASNLKGDAFWQLVGGLRQATEKGIMP